MRTATLFWRSVAALALPITLISAVSIPLTTSPEALPEEFTHIAPRDISGTFAIQRCSAPRPGKWMGQSNNHIGKDPYYKNFGSNPTPIREIRVFHSNKRIWDFRVTWQDGKTQVHGSSDWAPSGTAVYETWRLLDDEVITFMHVETFETSQHQDSIIGLQFQSNKGRWSPYFGRDRSKNLPQGLGRDYYPRHFIAAGNVFPEGSPIEKSISANLQYINSFELYMYGTNIGMQAIMPVWTSHPTTKSRMIVDIKSDPYAGQHSIGYEGYFTDADITLLSPQRLGRSFLKSIKLWRRAQYVSTMQLTWSDGVTTFTGPLRGAKTSTDESAEIIFEENQFVVGIEAWNSKERNNNGEGGVYSLQFIYNTYKIKGNGDIEKEQNITPIFGASNPSTRPDAKLERWGAPNKDQYSLIGFSGLWARPNGVAEKDQIRAMKPLWIQDGPIKSDLKIGSVKHGNIIAGVDAAKLSNNGQQQWSSINDAPTCLNLGGRYDYTTTVSNSIMVSDTTSITAGVTVSMSTTLTASAGAFGTKVEASANLGFEAFTEVGKEHTKEDTWETTKELTASHEWSATAPPYSDFRVTVRTGTAEVKDSTWNGTLTFTYKDGTTKDYEVDGTFAGTDNGMHMFVVVEYIPLEGHTLPDDWSCPNSRKIPESKKEKLPGGITMEVVYQKVEKFTDFKAEE